MAQTPVHIQMRSVSSRPCGYHGDPGLSPSPLIKMLESYMGGGGFVWEVFSGVCACVHLCVWVRVRAVSVLGRSMGLKGPWRVPGCCELVIKCTEMMEFNVCL